MRIKAWTSVDRPLIILIIKTLLTQQMFQIFSLPVTLLFLSSTFPVHLFAGILTSHVPTSQTPTPVLNFENSSANMAVFDRVYNEIRVIDTSHNVRVFSNFNEDRLRTAQFILLQETNNQPELCEIWTGLCPLVRKYFF